MEKTQEEITHDWYEFINNEFYLFRGNSRKTISDFAEQYGLPQAQMSQYMKKGGKVPRNQALISRFVEKHGNIIYKILGFPDPPDPIDSLPEPLRSMTKEFKSKMEESGFDGHSPEAAKLLDDTMMKFGYKLISTDDNDSEL